MFTEITCAEAENRINLYFAGKLEDEETIELFEHIKECASCKEEFTVQHLVSESMRDYDDWGELDSDKEIAIRQKEIQKRFQVKDFAERTYLGFVYLGVSAICLAILLFIL